MKLETKLKIACVVVDVVVALICILYFKPVTQYDWIGLTSFLFLILSWVDLTILMKDIMNR